MINFWVILLTIIFFTIYELLKYMFLNHIEKVRASANAEFTLQLNAQQQLLTTVAQKNKNYQ